MDTPPFNVLFLCTGNSARSILAESAFNKAAGPGFRAFSAGSQPKGAVNPDALRLLNELGYPTEGMRSKSWEEFAAPDAPPIGAVITVCDSAKGETCPVWPGHPVTAHWGIEDPSDITGDDAARRAAFAAALGFLEARIALFRDIPVTELDKPALREKLREIGKIAGASPGAMKP